MSELREDLHNAIAWFGGTSAQIDKKVDNVLRVLAEHGGVTNLREQIGLLVWRSANKRAERAEADLAAARQQLDRVRRLPSRSSSGMVRNYVLVSDLLAILDAPARPAGHDETGQ
jgi:hypothetical protein